MARLPLRVQPGRPRHRAGLAAGVHDPRVEPDLRLPRRPAAGSAHSACTSLRQLTPQNKLALMGLVPARAGRCRCAGKRDGTSPSPTEMPDTRHEPVGAGLVPARAGRCRCAGKRDGTSPSPTEMPDTRHEPRRGGACPRPRRHATGRVNNPSVRRLPSGLGQPTPDRYPARRAPADQAAVEPGVLRVRSVPVP